MGKRLFVLFFLFGVLFLSCSPAEEDAGGTDLPDDTIEIRNAWARPAARGMTGGAYLTILNGTETTDTLAGISSDATAMAEVHETYETEDGMSGMRPAENLTIGAGSTLLLSPGGYHIMLMQMNRDLAPGDSLSVTLHFARNEPLQVRIPVREQPVQE